MDLFMARIRTGKWFSPNALIIISIISIVLGLYFGIGHFNYDATTPSSEKTQGAIGALLLINGIINLIRGLYHKFED